MTQEDKVILVFGVHKIEAPAGLTIEEYYELYKDILRLPNDVVAYTKK